MSLALYGVAILPQIRETFTLLYGSELPLTAKVKVEMEKKSSSWPLILILAAFVAIINISEIRAFFSGGIVYDAAQAGEVVLYGTASCGYCRKARYFLNKNNIPFTDLDVEKSADARRDFERLGGSGVPVVTVGSKVVHGYDLPRLTALLNCAGCEKASNLSSPAGSSP